MVEQSKKNAPRVISYLHHDAGNYKQLFGLMGGWVKVVTNDPRVLKAAEQVFTGSTINTPDLTDRSGKSIIELHISLHTDIAAEKSIAAGSFVFLNHGHLFSTIFDSSNFVITDLLLGFASGQITEKALDPKWRLAEKMIETAAIAAMNVCCSMVSVHAACVAKDSALSGRSVLLYGHSGQGKTTLAYALVRRGYILISDDVVHAKRGPEGHLEVWGTSPICRLLPDTTQFFPELSSLEPYFQVNGEWKLEVNIENLYPARSALRTVPGPIVFLERNSDGPTRLESISREQEIEIVWTWDIPIPSGFMQTGAALSQNGMYRLHNNGTPDEAANVIDDWLSAP